MGLVPFSESDSAFFFGRDEWCDVVVDNLKAYRLTVLYGESGTGKTSLLRAGVVRELQERSPSQPRGGGHAGSLRRLLLLVAR